MARSNGTPCVAQELARPCPALDAARRACLELDPASVRPVPASFQDAFAVVARREEEKRKASKEPKSRRPLWDKATVPGAQLGRDAEASAFWMIMEARFR